MFEKHTLRTFSELKSLLSTSCLNFPRLKSVLIISENGELSTWGQNFQTSTTVYYRARPIFEEAKKYIFYCFYFQTTAVGFEDPGFLNYGPSSLFY